MQYVPKVEQKTIDFVKLGEDEVLMMKPKYKVFQSSPLDIIGAFLFYILVAIAAVYVLELNRAHQSVVTMAISLAIVGIPLSLSKMFFHALFEFLPVWKDNFATNEDLYLRNDFEYLEKRQQDFELHIAEKISMKTKEILDEQKTLYLQNLLIEDQSYKIMLQGKLDKYNDVLFHIEDLIEICKDSSSSDAFFIKESQKLQNQKLQIQELRDQVSSLLKMIEKGETLRSVYAIREEARFRVDKKCIYE